MQSFILAEGMHEDMLESMVYFMLFIVTTGTAIFLIGEIIWPQSFLASCGRCAKVRADHDPWM